MQQENISGLRKSETKTYSRAVTWNQFLRLSREEGMAGPCFENAEQQPGKSGTKMDSTREV